jgi:hypothetical protein
MIDVDRLWFYEAMTQRKKCKYMHQSSNGHCDGEVQV